MMCAQGQVVNGFPVWSLNAWSQKQSFPVPASQDRLEISKKLPIYQIDFLTWIKCQILKNFKLRKIVICQVREKFHTRQPVFSDAVKDLELCHQWVLRGMLLKLGKFIFIASHSAGWLVKNFFWNMKALILKQRYHWYNKKWCLFMKLATNTSHYKCIFLFKRSKLSFV